MGELDTIATDSLQVFTYTNEPSEETAFLIKAPKNTTTMADFILASIRKLNEVELIVDDYLQEFVQSSLFTNLTQDKFEVTSRMFTHFDLDDDVKNELKLFKGGYILLNDWDLNVSIIETDSALFCYACETTA